MFNVRNGLTNCTLAHAVYVYVPIFQRPLRFFSPVQVDGGWAGVRTPADGIVTLKHNRWDRSAKGSGIGLAYVFRHHTMTIFIRDDKRDRDVDLSWLFVSHDLPIGYYINNDDLIQ